MLTQGAGHIKIDCLGFSWAHAVAVRVLLNHQVWKIPPCKPPVISEKFCTTFIRYWLIWSFGLSNSVFQQHTIFAAQHITEHFVSDSDVEALSKSAR